MKLIQGVFRFYLQSSIHVGLAVISLVLVSTHFLNITPEPGFILFVFFTTIATYNFIKYGVEAYKYLIVSNRYHRIIQGFSLLNLFLALFFLSSLSKASIVLLFVVGLLIIVYAIPVYPRLKNLRNYGIPKVLLVALVWTLITLALPLVQYGIEWGWDRYIDLAQRYLLVLVLMVPFEIRDLNVDLPELKTIPQRIGEVATKRLGYLLAALNFLLTFLKNELHNLEVLGQFVLLFLLVLALFLTRKKQSRYFAAFWVEGLPIAWLAAIWLLSEI